MTLNPTWLARHRPHYDVVDVIGLRCRCGRKVYFDPHETVTVYENAERIAVQRCRGCDEIAKFHCYCPPVPARPEAIP